MSPREYLLQTDTNREVLLSKKDDILFVVRWLSDIKKTKEISGKCGSSNRLRHISSNRCVDNGVFITAAIIAGFDIKRLADGSVFFNMSCRSIQRKLGKGSPFEAGYSSKVLFSE